MISAKFTTSFSSSYDFSRMISSASTPSIPFTIHFLRVFSCPTKLYVVRSFVFTINVFLLCPNALEFKTKKIGISYFIQFPYTWLERKSPLPQKSPLETWAIKHKYCQLSCLFRYFHKHTIAAISVFRLWLLFSHKQ